jgi:hypothetical protein
VKYNPVVALNHAVAAAMVHGPRTGLDLLANLAVPARPGGSAQRLPMLAVGAVQVPVDGADRRAGHEGPQGDLDTELLRQPRHQDRREQRVAP